MFKRKIESLITDYFQSYDNKILVIDGARQVGKTFIIRELASHYFKNYIEINLRDDFDGDKYFDNVNTIKEFYLQLSALYGNDLGNFDDTIVFLDEIQTYPHLLSLLKLLNQDKRFRFIASGSLLGVTSKHEFIPMDSITEVKMYPMDFEEFLWANNVGMDVIDYLHQCFIEKTQVKDSIHKLILRRFREYLLSGGLPDAVKEFTDLNVAKMRNVQTEIYKYYKDDAAQYDSLHKLKIKTIYDFLPSYMENKVKRIKFKAIEGKVNANLVTYNDEFDYLIYSGIALGVRAVSDPVYPLMESSSKNLIKLYFNDVGILTNLLYRNNINAVLEKEYNVNLGSVYETAVAMELCAHGHDLYYFDSKKVGEVDFLINDYEKLTVVPVEIKSGNDQNNFRAIPKLVGSAYNLQYGMVFGNDNTITVKDNLVTYPIYMIMFV